MNTFQTLYNSLYLYATQYLQLDCAIVSKTCVNHYRSHKTLFHRHNLRLLSDQIGKNTHSKNRNYNYIQLAKMKDTYAVACHAMLCLLYNNPI